ncbi:hypothetical protein pEaSNUABM21_00208 [Erwinia phage pEa_SNUABM_21]|nr:hypothetical protein pEaSNUABM21_00208 [Erwinia phage pEa_SNUABM_21]
MELMVSLSAKIPAYTDRQQDIMWTMLHDKGHVIDANRSSPALDDLIAKYPERPEMPLYRGLYEKELMALFKQAKNPFVMINKYLSFSQDLATAKGFAKAGKTDTMLEILPGPKNKAFNYWQRTYNLIMAADLDKEFGGDEEEREMILDGLMDELEWIYPIDFRFRILKSRNEQGVQIITIQPV